MTCSVLTLGPSSGAGRISSGDSGDIAVTPDFPGRVDAHGIPIGSGGGSSVGSICPGRNSVQGMYFFQLTAFDLLCPGQNRF